MRLSVHDRARDPASRGRALAVRVLAACLLAPAAAAEPLDRALYGELLQRYTQATDAKVGTRVDYAGLRDEPQWQALVRNVEATQPSTLAGRAERLAYWIDVYNILAIRMVVEHYPVESIRDVGSFFFPVWKREAARIEDEPVTLGGIEHEILREMGEPRIHAAIVCASTSCPSLMRTPFRAAEIDAGLDAATRRFLANPDKGLRIDRAQSTVTVSKIFDWFDEDFESVGGVRAFVTRHAPEAARRWLESPAGRRADLEHFDYDWSLNDWKRAR